MKAKDVAFLGIMTSLSLCLSFVETLIPVFTAVPGVKIGLANIVILFVLYKNDFKSAFTVSVIRVLLSGILFSNLLTMAYSFAGAVVSLAVMFVLKKTDLFSALAVSICGGVCHNLAQIGLACFILSISSLKYYVPVLIISGIVSGAFVGAFAAFLFKRLDLNGK